MSNLTALGACLCLAASVGACAAAGGRDSASNMGDTAPLASSTGSTGEATSPTASVASQSTGDGGGSTTALSDSSSAGSSTTIAEATSSTGGEAFAGGTIIPLYTYPTLGETWNDVAAASAAHPELEVIAIINPSSGPGTDVDANYTTGVANLKSAGVVVVGYVPTGYADRSLAAVQGDIDQYVMLYPEIDGIFFDQMSNEPENESYYRGLSDYGDQHGLDRTIGNPGADVPEILVGSVDTLVIYESAGEPDVASLGGWHDSYGSENFAILPYAVAEFDAEFVAMARAHVGYVYVTDDTLDNPWDSLPSYFDQLLDALDAE